MTKNVLVRFKPEDIERIDQIAKELDTSRERLIKKYVNFGMEDFKLAKGLGLTSILPIFKKLKININCEQK